MRILVTGASGWIGSEVLRCGHALGHTMLSLGRRGSSSGVVWDPPKIPDLRPLAPLDGVIHLAGESILGWWSAAKRHRILHSRVDATRALVEALLQLPTPPAALVSVSACGYYGDCGETLVTPEQSPGTSFLSSVCVAWEAEASRAIQGGIRVVLPRLGTVLDPSGGAWHLMVRATRWGLAARLGGGMQWWPWMSRADVVQALFWLLEQPQISGPLHCVAPHPVQQGQAASALASALHRPCWRIPAIALRCALPGVAEELLLPSCHAVPDARLATALAWQDPTLDSMILRTVASLSTKQ